MSQVNIVVLAVIKNKNKFLLTKRYQPDFLLIHDKWQLPGGGLEFEEHPEQTAIRETKEEVGLTVGIIKLIPAIETKVIETWQGVFIGYLCKILHSDEKVILDEEASEYGWFTLSEIEEMDKKGTILSKSINYIIQSEK